MSIIISILTVLEVIACLLLSLLVLMQKPRQEGLGAAFGGGMMDSLMGAQTTNFLQRFTVYFGIALFVLTFLLAVLTSRMDQHKPGAKLVDSSDLKTQAAAAPATPAVPAPVPPAAPAQTKPADEKPAAPAPAAQTAPTPAPAAPVTPPPAAPAKN